MWYRLNEVIGIVFLIAVVGGGAIYGLVTVVTGPPLVRQENQEIDARHNRYTRGIMKEHDKRMRELQQQQSEALQEAVDVGRRAQSF